MDLDLARNWTDILIGGIDFDLPGNGGDECWNFMTLKRRLFETIFVPVSNLSDEISKLANA